MGKRRQVLTRMMALRLTPADQELIGIAANAADESLSEFVRDAARARALDVLRNPEGAEA